MKQKYKAMLSSCCETKPVCVSSTCYEGMAAYSVSEIAEALDENPSVISNHLAILHAAGMVSKERYQAYAYYSLTEGAMEQYMRRMIGSLVVI